MTTPHLALPESSSANACSESVFHPHHPFFTLPPSPLPRCQRLPLAYLHPAATRRAANPQLAIAANTCFASSAHLPPHRLPRGQHHPPFTVPLLHLRDLQCTSTRHGRHHRVCLQLRDPPVACVPLLPTSCCLRPVHHRLTATTSANSRSATACPLARYTLRG